MDLQPLLCLRLKRPEKEDFPDHEPNGYMKTHNARQLGQPITGFDHSYRSKELPQFPDCLEFEVNQDGIMDVLVWSQKLYFRAHLIFRNESVSWVVNQTMLKAGGAADWN
jgi:hypothetical protein